MSVTGKIMGGALGLVLSGGPIGALAGAAAGHALDLYISAVGERGVPAPTRRQFVRTEDPDPTRRYGFTIAVIVLGAKLAKSDGHVTQTEIHAFREVFRVSPGDVQAVGKIFNQARRHARGFETYAEQLADDLHDYPGALEEVLHCLFHIAAADGPVNPSEAVFLRKVTNLLGLEDSVFIRYASAYSEPERAAPEPPKPDAWRLLGLKPSMSDAEIKAAYKNLVRKIHPDALASKGAAPAEIDKASARLARINAAYDLIAAERGLR